MARDVDDVLDTDRQTVEGAEKGSFAERAIPARLCTPSAENGVSAFLRRP